MANTKSYKAVVEKVVSGKHGPYVVTRNEELGVVTFALDTKIWSEEHQPEPGDRVILSRIVSHLTNKRAVWRAKKARAENPSDEQ